MGKITGGQRHTTCPTCTCPELAVTAAAAVRGPAPHPAGCRECDITIGGQTRTMLGPREAAAWAGCSPATIYRLIREERIPTLNLQAGCKGGGNGSGQRYLIRACVVRQLDQLGALPNTRHPE